jgi:uncharacterized membrane protein (DUF2068 family)
MQRPHDINIVIGIGIFAIIAIAMYWITWFAAPQLIQSRTPEAADYQVYVNFEQAFPLADGFIAIASLIGVIGLWRMKSWGFLSMMLGAGGAIFLGLMDLLYDIEHSMFVPLNAETAIELIIVIITLSLGPIMTTLLWRRRKDFMQ